MDKEEVLAKSRMENKGRDMPVIEENKNAARFAIIFGFCFMAVVAFLSFIAHSKMIYGVAAMEFCIVFAMNLYNAIKKKNRKYIIMTVTTGITLIVFSFITVCEIFKIYP